MTNQEATITEGKTLKGAAEAYLESLAAGGTKPTTINVYKKSLDLAITYFGAERELSSILLPQVGKFYAGKEINVLPSGKPKAEPTIKQNKRVFRQMMEFAQGQNWIADLPVPKAELQHARIKKEEPDAKIAPRLRGQDFMPVVKHQK